MILNFTICDKFSKKSARGLIKSKEPTFKGVKGYAVGMVVYDVDEIYEDIINERIKGFTARDIGIFRSLVNNKDANFIAIQNPDAK